jgi:CubicO group peptidase (beta-lactamase class C family)
VSDEQLMTGFPPSDSGQVTLANWRTAPFNRWAFQHVREIVPSADIVNAPNDVWTLPSATVDFSGFSFKYEGKQFDFGTFLAATATDGIHLLYRGCCIAEFYAHGMTARTPHILMSVSKSLLGIIAGILVEKGILDFDQPVTHLVPEVARTAYRGATIRNLLDMRVGVQFDENYLANSGLIIDYRKSHNWDPLGPGDVKTDLRSFFQRLTRSDGAHGGAFHYVSPNTDLMGWLIERAANRRYADIVSELLWQPLGAANNAYITVDRLGAPRSAGGVCSTVADLARVGQLIAQNGRRGAAQIIPQGWIDDIVHNGDSDAWTSGDLVGYFPKRMHYRGKWYVLHGPDPLMFAFGIHGQYLFVDPRNEIVIAKVSSQPVPLDAKQIMLTFTGVEAIRRFLV